MNRYFIPRPESNKIWAKSPDPLAESCVLKLKLDDGTAVFAEPQGIHIEEPFAKCPAEKAEGKLWGAVKNKYAEIKAEFDGASKPKAAVLFELELMESGHTEISDGKFTYAMWDFALVFTAELPAKEYEPYKVDSFIFERRS